MEYVEEITLELNSNTAYTTIGAKQGDADTRTVWIRLTQNGEDYHIDDDVTAYFRFRKPDGKAVVNRTRIENNKIQLVFTRQTLAVAGRGYGDITLQRGTQILSSVAFIVIIMASPEVGSELTSSNEFGELVAVVGDAHNIMYEAEAWAAGTRGGVEVVGENSFESDYISEIISAIHVNQSGFFGDGGASHEPGTYRIFTFTYQGTSEELGAWRLNVTTYDGNDEIHADPIILPNLNSYGISYDTPSGVNPSHNDKIIVYVKEKDSAFENNAKYYAEQAALERGKIEELTVSAESSLDADVIKESIEDDVQVSYVSEVITAIEFNQEQFLSVIEYNPHMHCTFQFTNEGTTSASGDWTLVVAYDNGLKTTYSDPITVSNLSEYGISYTTFFGYPAYKDQIIVDIKGHYNLHFYLPKGETGDVNLMGFYIDTDMTSPAYGNVISCRPDSMLCVSIKQRPDSIILALDEARFLNKNLNNFGTYQFKYVRNSNQWNLTYTAAGESSPVINYGKTLSDYGISYELKPSAMLLNNSIILIKYFEQTTFSINEDGNLCVDINMEV